MEPHRYYEQAAFRDDFWLFSFTIVSFCLEILHKIVNTIGAHDEHLAKNLTEVFMETYKIENKKNHFGLITSIIRFYIL